MDKKTFKELTTFRVGGEIKYYKEVKNRAEVVSAVKFAKRNNLSIFVLGGGTDILVSDEPFEGVVIKYVGNKLYVTGNKLTAEAGMEWDKLVEYAVENNLQGVECLSGIPGTVGAAPIQNIGAYGQELKDIFVKLTAYDIEKEKFVVFDKKDCEFSYRESIFKKKEFWQRYVIAGITLELKKYEDKDIELSTIRNEILRVRSEKLPDPKKIPNAGSFFKNPIIEGNKISAARLIEDAGWKGKTYKNTGVSSRHALVIINRNGKATAEEIIELSEKIIADVDKKFGIKLEREVQLINFPKKVAILGYGIEGQDAERYIKNQKLNSKIKILDQKFDRDYLKNLDQYDLVIRSPGVYPGKPELKNANVTTPIQIFFENCPGKIIGVTGTKGKGTTATLIYEILKKAGKEVYLAGNIGKPYLELLSVISHKSYTILEMSSFQLIDIKSSPHIAVVLNITSDHIDWHKSQKEYIEAKKNIVKFQMPDDYALINEEYKTPKSFSKETKAKVIYFSKQKLENKFKEKPLLRGEHNLENIAAAVSVAKILGIRDEVILTTVRSFKGLEHRLELVGEVDGVTFYNDSFATGPQPTIAAIKSFTEPLSLILGGSDKGLEYGDLRREIEKRENIKNIILIGEIGEKIGRNIKGKNIINLGKTSMIRIIEVAKKVTPGGGVVLLSPAAASFDMFENYKDRGNQFKEAVRNLKK